MLRVDGGVTGVSNRLIALLKLNPTLHSHGPVPNSVPSGACHRIDGGSCREATRLRMYCIVLAVPVERKEKRTKKKFPTFPIFLVTPKTFGERQQS